MWVREVALSAPRVQFISSRFSSRSQMSSQFHEDQARGTSYAVCPNCKSRHLPLHGIPSSGIYKGNCINCGHVFKFKYTSQPKDSITITVNGTQHQVATTFSTQTSLIAYLRDELHLKGTKKMCFEGGCGCCVVTATYIDPVTKKSRSQAINSCLCPLYACDGWEITTIEGLGNHKTGFHAIQERLADNNGSQCGYCSPGMVMNMYGFLQSHPTATKQDIEDAFDGVLCRCTGFRPILDAMKSFGQDAVQTDLGTAVDIEEIIKLPCKKGKDCCGGCHKNSLDNPGAGKLETIRLSLKQGDTWYQPAKLSDVYPLIKSNLTTGYRLVAGNTSIGVYKGDPWSAPAMIDIRRVPELKAMTVTDTFLLVGGAVTLTDLITKLQTLAKDSGFGYLTQPISTLMKVANLPVRNVATWAGNLMIKHKHPEFPSDVFCFLATVGAAITIVDDNGLSETMSLETFLSSDMTGKVITSCRVPKNTSSQLVVRTYKVMSRSENSHAVVNAGLRLVVDKPNNYNVIDLKIYFGGINTSFVRATMAEKYLIGKSLSDNQILQGALSALRSDVKPDNSGGLTSPEYRLSLVLSLLYRFILDTCGDVVADQYKAGASGIHRPLSSGQQVFDTQPDKYPVSKPTPKVASRLQTAGEAEFVSDMATQQNEVYAKFVVSTVANAELDKIDASQALKVPGVLAVLTYKDIPGTNNFMYMSDAGVEEVLCSGKVLYAGQPLAILVTETEGLGYYAVDLVKVTYKNVRTPILNIDQAIAAGSYFDVDPSATLKVGDADGAISKSTNTVSGKVYLGGQFHFHMETQVCRAIPTDDGLLLHPTTQWMDGVQRAVANVLGMNNSRIQLTQRRIGGSFGARITRNHLVSCACALAASHTNRPVYMKLDLKTNMASIGGRHPCMADYQVGFTKDGKLNGIKMTAYEDSGCSPNDNVALLLKYWIDNVYYCANWQVIPKMCKTNAPSSTSLRAPGSSQATFLIESIMEHVAKSLNKDPSEIKKLNLYKQGQVTPTGMTLKYWNVDTLIGQLETSSDFTKRQQEIETFNKANRWKKKALSLVPHKFGATWQGGRYPVFVTIFNGDGTIGVAHGGVESGQGCDVKVLQTVAFELGVPLNMVTIQPNNSLTNSNCATTGGSITSELACYGAIQCCSKLKERMKPVRDSLPATATWTDVVHKCYNDGVDLAYRFFVNEGLSSVMVYNCYGVCVTEVELDVLTGENQTNRVDLLMDVGTSINPEIDVGQIEGGFMMGMGGLLTEEKLYDQKTGKCLTAGTWEYKPPASKDIPVDFRVSLLKNAPNPVGVLGSKAIGEPPTCISCAVLLAAKHAVEAARKDMGHDVYFPMNAPATVERLHTNCMVDSTKFLIK